MGELRLSLGKPPSEQRDKDKVQSMEFDLYRTAEKKKKKGKPKDK